MCHLICTWANGWENNRDARDLRRQRPRYDVTVMNTGAVCFAVFLPIRIKATLLRETSHVLMVRVFARILSPATEMQNQYLYDAYWRLTSSKCILSVYLIWNTSAQSVMCAIGILNILLNALMHIVWPVCFTVFLCGVVHCNVLLFRCHPSIHNWFNRSFSPSKSGYIFKNAVFNLVLLFGLSR